MSQTLLKSFQLDIPVDYFLQNFWLSKFYEKFLEEKLLDKEISTETWRKESNIEDLSSTTSSSSSSSSISSTIISINCFNENEKIRKTIQSLHPSKVSFPGLPSHANCQKNQTIFYSKKPKGLELCILEISSFQGIPYADYFKVHTKWEIKPSEEKSSSSIDVYIYFSIEFIKSTWLQSTIISNTKSELIEVFDLWHRYATEYISENFVLKTNDEFKDGYDNNINLISSNITTSSQNLTIQKNFEEEGMLDDEDLLFFDCEEGDRLLSRSTSFAQSPNSSNYRQYSSDSYNKYNSSNEFPKITNSKDLAVQIVETLFVFAEFFFWQIHQFYTYDLKEMFSISPSIVISRTLSSFVPSLHGPLLKQPDMYGPLVAVFSLPQTLLLSMEGARNDCDPTSQLGNIIIVCLFVWIGLSLLYRFLAIFVAPSIQFKHCLCVTGYSFFFWSLAILSTLPLEHYRDSISLPILTPLIIIGLPCSIAQGFIFWESTPHANQTNNCPSIFNFKILESLARALPKIIAFILIAGTHYQLLWYIARVFLPGSRQLCRLSALIKPTIYADILTQKELRIFASNLFNGKN